MLLCFIFIYNQVSIIIFVTIFIMEFNILIFVHAAFWCKIQCCAIDTVFFFFFVNGPFKPFSFSIINGAQSVIIALYLLNPLCTPTSLRKALKILTSFLDKCGGASVKSSSSIQKFSSIIHTKIIYCLTAVMSVLSFRQSGKYRRLSNSFNLLSICSLISIT